WAGVELTAIGDAGMDPLIARPRWPLDTRAPALLGHGNKGAKA
ncbi:MAG: tRNA (adenosine(37)-N6)-threonylcarbamoyltransferase complex transferase subunit TsaD, partial [Silicimonas sp.]|nr:tRNA (adenosine(37)-N6)-threonylcarbamoyltransferase complex transferase subunit TsaD [Silicimonas sp.]